MTLFQNMRRGLLPARMSVDAIYDLVAAGVLAESERLELIDGEIVPTAAAKARWHTIMEGKLIPALVRQLPDDVRLYPAPSLTLSSNTLLEPDFLVGPIGRAGRELSPGEVLLVIEVSDSSLSYDLRVKAPLYAAGGVREYWVVDAVRQTIRVHRAPHGGTYTDVEEYEAHDEVTALIPGVSVRLDALE